jgi:starch synthase
MVQFLVREEQEVKDTVIDFGDNGMVLHDQSSVGDICYSIQRAITCIR